MYGGALDLRETLDYDFKTEQEFSYSDMTLKITDRIVTRSRKPYFRLLYFMALLSMTMAHPCDKIIFKSEKSLK